MKTSEEEIGMQDRVLAQQIELLIWNACPIPNEPILCSFIEILRQSSNTSDFIEKAREFVDKIKTVKWKVRATYEGNTIDLHDIGKARTIPCPEIFVYRKNVTSNESNNQS